MRLPSALWPHQKAAITKIRDYLSSSDTDSHSALITMPTGTGKTGVIAAATTLIPSVAGHRLVITPWSALVLQLIDDLGGRFWDHLDWRPADIPKVLKLPSSSRIAKGFPANKPTIYVTTISAINKLKERAPDLGYDISTLFSDFDFVIVDEGHYEPAFEWSQAIRGLNLPTILLTATPYRNDRKFFRPSGAHQYRLAHHKAEEDQFLRQPLFSLISEKTAQGFVEHVVALVDSKCPDDTKVIIRCENADGIRAIVHALEGLAQPVVGIHDTFRPSGSLLNRVPSPDTHAARYWVHQYKLIEGIDDPHFRVLAFYKPLRNDRAMIQQIGRVLRNPQRRADDMAALVIDNIYPAAERSWAAYRAFDKQEQAKSVATLPQLVTDLLEAQPDAFYYDGAYRKQIDLNDPQAWREFIFPPRVRVYKPGRLPGLPLEEITDQILADWEDQDRTVFTVQAPDSRTRVLPYVSASNSRLLRRAIFIEPKFGYTVLRISGQILFMYDTQGATPRAVEEHFRPLEPSELQPLFPRGSVLTSVSLLNTDIGRQSARSRHVSAVSIDELAPDLADHAYVCSIAQGYVEVASNNGFRRYVGLSRSRITDFHPTVRDFESYGEWLDQIEKELTTPNKATSTFERYATLADTPEDPSPIHVLLDIDQTQFSATKGKQTVPLQLGETAHEVNDGKFDITLTDGKEVKVYAAELKWDPEKSRYHLDADDLRQERYLHDDEETHELVEAINRDQALRVIPSTGTVVYSHGHFFKPQLPSRRRGSFDLLGILHTDPSLETVTEEKGRVVNGGWGPNTTFGLISALVPNPPFPAPAAMTTVFNGVDFLLCTDMGTEIADFIASQDKRVALIHAKASSTTHKYSASELHVVTSQAIKNLVYLHPMSEEVPRYSQWDKGWPSQNDPVTTHRLRVGNPGPPADLWNHVRGLIADPSAEREVWLVLGNSLSKSALIKESKRRRPTPEALQALTLLQAAWVAVSQVGARLRVFCSP